MKKVISVILIVALLLSMSISAAVASETDGLKSSITNLA